MKHTLIRKVSKKQAKRNRELSKITPPEDGKCQQCHELPDFRGLAKHHIVLRSRGGKDNLDNLLWVCGSCHSEFHGIREIG
jgi:5-methylcytosine-specific restriction endonuclease McrA